MRTEQAELERQLWNERRGIQQKHEERVKTARTKLVRRVHPPRSPSLDDS